MTVFLQFSNKNDGIANVAGQNDHFWVLLHVQIIKKNKNTCWKYPLLLIIEYDIIYFNLLERILHYQMVNLPSNSRVCR